MVYLEEKVESLSKKIQGELIGIRREIHKFPELSWEEKRTSELIIDKLKVLRLDVLKKISKFGVVGVIEGKGGGKTLAIRSEMDALPIDKELTGTAYASKNKSIMHACGHDAHIAIVLGAAMILSHFKDHIKGKIKFIFQPSEEMQPSGALTMIKEGVLKNPKVDAIIAGHTFPLIDVGKVGVKAGVMMASSDFFEIIIEGEGGHAAYPHLSTDAMVCAAGIIQQLQTIVSRRINPLDSVVVTIATINGGSNYCTIANNIKMTGTVRTLKEDLRQKMSEMMEEIIFGVSKSFGTAYKFNYRRETPILLNDPIIAKLFVDTTAKMLGKKNVLIIDNPQMGAEDFAFFLEKVPGIFFRIGVRSEKRGINYPLHSPRYNIDEEALSIGSKVMANFAINYCK
jgi:amidohydrolase